MVNEEGIFQLQNLVKKGIFFSFIYNVNVTAVNCKKYFKLFFRYWSQNLNYQNLVRDNYSYNNEYKTFV